MKGKANKREMVEGKSRWGKAWTGPRTARGKRRSALNRLKRGLCPGWVEQQLQARGENPEDFRQLHRDLMGHLRPDDARSRVIVETLAETWWEKMRLLRGWVGAGRCDTKEIDARIDNLVQRLVWAMQHRHRKWRSRLESELGKGLYGAAVVRIRLESLVRVLGGKPPARRAVPQGRDRIREFRERLAGLTELLSAGPRPSAAEKGTSPQ
jgi:hypothetical protein